MKELNVMARVVGVVWLLLSAIVALEIFVDNDEAKGYPLWAKLVVVILVPLLLPLAPYLEDQDVW